MASEWDEEFKERRTKGDGGLKERLMTKSDGELEAGGSSSSFTARLANQTEKKFHRRFLFLST